MTILDKIIEHKRAEVAAAKELVSLEDLKVISHYSRKTISLVKSLLAISSSGIIAEFKRQSPSKGTIKENADVVEITSGYSFSGAAGISVLTDGQFFGGAKEDLIQARVSNPDTPLLRKDFMIDSYQLHEAKAWGADVILLIAANLTPQEIADLSAEAKSLDLEVLLEIHDKEELGRSPLENVDILGVNNRNLKNFAENNVNASLDLIQILPEHKVKISESCISKPETVKQLRNVGYKGFLMGENFMKTENPGETLAQFIRALA